MAWRTLQRRGPHQDEDGKLCRKENEENGTLPDMKTSGEEHEENGTLPDMKARKGKKNEDTVTTDPKTNQYNFESLQNHYSAGSEICVAKAMVDLGEHFPACLTGGSEAEEPLFRYAREEVQKERKQAVTAFEQSQVQKGPHSSRIGGAKAMSQLLKDLEAVKHFGGWLPDASHSLHQKDHEAVKRFGKWLSGASDSYPWESQEQQKDLAVAMATFRSALVAPHGA